MANSDVADLASEVILLVAAACLCASDPWQWPKTGAKLGNLLRRRGCCAVRFPQAMPPQALIQVMLPALEHRPSLYQLIQPYTAMVLTEPDVQSPEYAGHSDRVTGLMAAAGIRAAKRFAQLPSGWFESLTSRQQIAWLCSQAYVTITADADSIIEDFASRNLLSRASSDQLAYNVEGICALPVLVRKPWNPAHSGLMNTWRQVQVHELLAGIAVTSQSPPSTEVTTHTGDSLAVGTKTASTPTADCYSTRRDGVSAVEEISAETVGVNEKCISSKHFLADAEHGRVSIGFGSFSDDAKPCLESNQSLIKIMRANSSRPVELLRKILRFAALSMIICMRHRLVPLAFRIALKLTSSVRSIRAQGLDYSFTSGAPIRMCPLKRFLLRLGVDGRHHERKLVEERPLKQCRHCVQLGSVTNMIELDGIGGGQVLRSAFVYGALLGQPVRVSGIHGAKKTPGMRPAQVAALDTIERFSGSKFIGKKVDSIAATIVPPACGIADFSSLIFDSAPIDSGTGGSTMLMLQAALPLMLAQSAARGSDRVSVTLRGGTNVKPPGMVSHFQINAPQVEFAQLVLLPMLQRLFGFSLELQLHRRGFIGGGGEVEVHTRARSWPPPAFDLVHPGKPVRAYGVCYGSHAAQVLEVRKRGISKGSSALLHERLQVPQMWSLSQNVPTGTGGDSGLVAVIETSTGCLLAGDSMCRAGIAPAEVGEEAAQAALAAVEAGGCVDQHLQNQLVIFMTLAEGTSRLRLGRTEHVEAHMRSALMLAERIGAGVRMLNDVDQTMLLEIDGIGAKLRLA
mmetsp:Transcript_62703/g.173801  ORF Transcript_62703/g.173801 Transcript_62703/m.173801 type:complete len:797 (+) Transcript_62703:78-2468(+)